ncbi:MAG: replication initiator protein A [Planctomycetes bacterium]|nr:replication initiator protein A [Planctomycetota bacterium]
MEEETVETSDNFDLVKSEDDIISKEFCDLIDHKIFAVHNRIEYEKDEKGNSKLDRITGKPIPLEHKEAVRIYKNNGEAVFEGTAIIHARNGQPTTKDMEFFFFLIYFWGMQTQWGEEKNKTNKVRINARNILGMMGLTDGGGNYNTLVDRLERLKETTLTYDLEESILGKPRATKEIDESRRLIQDYRLERDKRRKNKDDFEGWIELGSYFLERANPETLFDINMSMLMKLSTSMGKHLFRVINREFAYGQNHEYELEELLFKKLNYKKEEDHHKSLQQIRRLKRMLCEVISEFKAREILSKEAEIESKGAKFQRNDIVKLARGSFFETPIGEASAQQPDWKAIAARLAYELDEAIGVAPQVVRILLDSAEKGEYKWKDKGTNEEHSVDMNYEKLERHIEWIKLKMSLGDNKEVETVERVKNPAGMLLQGLRGVYHVDKELEHLREEQNKRREEARKRKESLLDLDNFLKDGVEKELKKEGSRKTKLRDKIESTLSPEEKVKAALFAENLKKRLKNNTLYDTWFSDLFCKSTNGTISCVVPNRFAENWIMSNYRVILFDVFHEVFETTENPKIEVLKV